MTLRTALNFRHTEQAGRFFARVCVRRASFSDTSPGLARGRPLPARLTSSGAISSIGLGVALHQPMDLGGTAAALSTLVRKTDPGRSDGGYESP